MTTKLTEKNISSVANAGINWQSVIVADGSTGTTGVAGRGYFINTTSAAHIFTLPATATFADTILIKDYAGTFGTNALTINRNGHNIQGVANNSLINTNRASVVLVYVDVTRGWEFVTESNVADLGEPLFIAATGGTVTTDGNFKIHTFTNDGCFAVSQVGNSPTVPTGGPSSVDYLVVAGGGSAGAPYGAGGGAGGFREGRVLPAPESYTASPLVAPGGLPVSATTYPITVGAGAAGQANPSKGLPGSNSIFSTITSAGGGGGSHFAPGPVPGRDGLPGGSGGGGGGGAFTFVGGGAGAGNTPPVNPSQGNPGGQGSAQYQYGAAGGGGAGSAGNQGNDTPTGSGGNGAGTGINPSPTIGTPGPSPTLRYFAGGGADYAFPGNGGGGYGGGGGTGLAGTANTGGGGGGEGATGAGGKGIVIIRYKFQ